MFEQINNIYTVVVLVIGLIICLFHYIDKPRRSWIYVTVFLLASLLSNYYWAAYCLLMGDDPTISSFTAYFGDNISFIPLILLLIHRYREEKVRYFNPLCLLPVPLNIYQCMLYNEFGGIFNNVWQCSLSTIVAVLALNKIIYFVTHRKKGAKRPYISFALLWFILFEYTMWTSSCYDWPNQWLDPYNYAAILTFSSTVLIPVAVSKTFGEKVKDGGKQSSKKLRSIFKPLYVDFVLLCCVGGYLLTMWVLFSAILVVFSVAIIFVVTFMNKAAQSERFKEEKNEAVQSNEAKSEFLANMSHEIRTPINAVLGMNEMVLRESLKARDTMTDGKSELRETFSNICNYSGNIESAGKNLLSIINDILDFSKIEAGRMEILNNEYRLSSVLNDVSNMIFFRAKAKGLSFDVDVDEKLPDVLTGDEVHVRQAIINVLNNAVKYTNEGGVHLSVYGKKERDVMNGFWVSLTFRVQDTGIGIRKQDLEKLFSKFERVDLDKNRAVEGTGLGLAITRNLLEMMGGEVSVESVYGSGSTFTIQIPQMIVSDEPVGDFREKFEKNMEKAEAYQESFVASEAKILVVDDTQVNLVVVKGLLRETQLIIETAGNGADAIRMANANAYDVILLDQLMPDIGGTEALKKIREQKDGRNRETPIICLTADAIAGARERYIAEGFTDYLTKPIDSKELERMLIQYLPTEKVTIK